MKLLPKLTLALGCAMFIVFCCVLYITCILFSTNLRNNSEETLKELAYQTMTKIDHRILFERMGDLVTIASDPIISSQQYNPQEITKRLIDYRNTSKTYVSLSFFDLNRIRIADTMGMDIGKQDFPYSYWNDVTKGKLSIGTEIEISRSLKLPVIFFASPVKDKNNKMFGVLVARVPVHKLYEIMREISLSPKFTNSIKIDLTDKDGLLIYSNHNSKGILTEKLSDWDVMKRIAIGEQAGIINSHRHCNSEEVISVFCVSKGYLDLKGNGWILILHFPLSIIYKPIYNLLYSWLFWIFPVVVLVTIVCILFLNKSLVPLSELTKAVETFGQGNFSVHLNIKSKDEIGILSGAFNQMADNLKKTTTSIENLILEAKERKKLEEALKVAHDNLEERVIKRTADLKLVEEELRRISLYNRDLIETNLDSLVTISKDGKIMDVNNATEAITGYHRNKLIGKDFSDLFTNYERAKEGYKKVLSEGFVRDYPLAVKDANGKVTDIMYNATVYRNEKGDIQGILASARDVSSIKATEEALINKCVELNEQAHELRKMQDQLIRSEKLAAIGQLSSSIAHELRNPLGIIKNVIYYLQMQGVGKNNEEVKDNLDIVCAEIERSNKIITDLLGYSKIKHPILTRQNINMIIVESLEKMITCSNIKILTQLDKDLPEIPVDKIQILQIFTNILANAVQAMEQGGTIIIKSIQESNFVKVLFMDTGIGIPKDNMDKIFEPLFSTKAYGTGFGLSIVKLLVEKHNGKIEVESVVGEGSKFVIALPIET